MNQNQKNAGKQNVDEMTPKDPSRSESIDKLIIETLQTTLESTEFDLKTEKKHNEYLKSVSETHSLLYEAFNNVKEFKKEFGNPELFSDADKIVEEALKWYIKQLCSQIEENDTKSIEINELQQKIKNIEIQLSKEIEKYKAKNYITEKETTKKENQNKEKIEKMESNQKNLEEEISKLTEKAKLEISAMKKELEKAQKLAEESESRLEVALKDFKRLMTRVEEKYQSLRKEKENFDAKIIRIENEAEKKLEEVKLLEKKVEKKREKILLLKKKISAFKLKVDSALSKGNSYKEKLSKRDFELETEKKLYRILKKDYDENLKKVKSLYSKLENKQIDLLSQTSLYESAKVELLETKKMLKEMTENTKFESKSHREIEKDMQKMRIDNLRLKQEKDLITHSMKRLERDNSEIRNFYLNEKDKKQTGKKKLLSKSKNLSLEGFLKSEMQKLKVKLCKNDDENVNLKQKLSDSENKLNEDKMKNEEERLSFENEILDLKHKLKTSQSNFHIKSTSFGKNKDIQKKMRTEMTKMQKKINDLDSKNILYEEKIASLEMEKVDLKNRYEDKEKGFATLKKEISNCQNTKQSGKKLNLTLIELEKTKQRNRELKNNIKKLETTEYEFDKKLEEKEKEIRKLKNGKNKNMKSPKAKIRPYSLFEVYSENSKKCKNIVNEEMKRWTKIMDEENYGFPKSKGNSEKKENQSTNFTERVVRRNLTKDFESESEKEVIAILEDDSDQKTKNSPQKGKKRKKMANKKTSKNVTKQSKNKKIKKENDDSEEKSDGSIDVKRLPLRERIGMSKQK